MEKFKEEFIWVGRYWGKMKSFCLGRFNLRGLLGILDMYMYMLKMYGICKWYFVIGERFVLEI